MFQYVRGMQLIPRMVFDLLASAEHKESDVDGTSAAKKYRVRAHC